MKHTEYEIKVAIQVLKPVQEVFESIVNPEIMAEYFIKRGDKRMEENTEVIWEFPEFEGTFPVQVKDVRKNDFISFCWDVEGKIYLVEMTLQSTAATSTVVTITERALDDTVKDIKWLKDNTEGWANFLACLKANLEYRINLRKGAFDFRFKESKTA